jgi:Holliday junction resolvase
MRRTWQQQVQRSSTHAELLRAIVQYLELTGWLVLVTPRGGVPGLAGLPDLLALKDERFLPVEVKAGYDKLRPEQVIMAVRLEAAGFPVLEARSIDDVVKGVNDGER